MCWSLAAVHGSRLLDSGHRAGQERGHRVVLTGEVRGTLAFTSAAVAAAGKPAYFRAPGRCRSRSRPSECRKWGGLEFVSPWHDGRGETFNFEEGWNKSLPLAYQVRRSEFDEILIRRAAHQGTRVFEGCRVRDIELLPEGRSDGMRARVEAEHDDGTTVSWLAQLCSGRLGSATLTLSTGQPAQATKRRNSKHNSAALFGHFRHADRYPEEKRAGNISIYWFDHGWFWFIPLSDGVTSIGAVVWPRYMKSRAVPVRDFFLATIQMCAPLAARLKDAELVSDVEATGNYSYSCERSHGPGYVLVGRCVRFHRSDVLVRCVDGHGQWSRSGRGPGHLSAPAGPLRGGAVKEFDRVVRHGPRKNYFLVHLSHHQSHHARPVHGAAKPDFRMKEAMLGPAGWRHLRQHADLEVPAGIQRRLLRCSRLSDLKRSLCWLPNGDVPRTSVQPSPSG